MEKGFNKFKMSGWRDFFDGLEVDRGNVMECLDLMQGGLVKGIKWYSCWDLFQVRYDLVMKFFVYYSIGYFFYLLFMRLE